MTLFAASASAEPAKPPPAPAPAAAPKVEGTFGFDVMKPKQKCAKVAGALLTKLTRSYDCKLPDNGGQTGSGVQLLTVCTVKKGPQSEYMLFGSAADCNNERETQLANAG